MRVSTFMSKIYDKTPIDLVEYLGHGKYNHIGSFENSIIGGKYMGYTVLEIRTGVLQGKAWIQLIIKDLRKIKRRDYYVISR